MCVWMMKRFVSCFSMLALYPLYSCRIDYDGFYDRRYSCYTFVLRLIFRVAECSVV